MSEEQITPNNGSYSADSIQVLEGLEAVRKRPAMYIGDISVKGLHHLVYEIVDNSIDEALAGYCDHIEVTINEDNSITVQDNGRGIPVDYHEKEKKSALEVAMTVLHAGGKFDKGSYKVSGGLHGVGMSCVNALSTHMTTQVFRNGKIYQQEYEIGKPLYSVKEVGTADITGTRQQFWPDGTIFTETVYDYKILASRLRELAYLNAGLRISLTDRRVVNEDGSFKHVRIGKKEYWGHKLLQKTDQLIRTAYFDEDGSEEKNFALDYMWYMWCGPDAPSFDKDKMATFERYFVADKALHKENKGYYYTLRNRADICDSILTEFGVEPGPHSHIINGHVPVKTIKGERPIKADGKLLVIDGGFSKAYQPETGIAGYTLVYHSHGMQLVQHDPFQSRQKAIEEGQDIKSTTFVIEFNSQRMMVKDTDKGKQLVTQIQDLKKLLVAYRTGLIKEKEIF